MPLLRTALGCCTVLLVGGGCGHTVPFSGGVPDEDPGFTNLVPRRLTYSEGADIHPQWTADGSAIIYTFEQQLPGDEYPDRCLGALPADGGSRQAEWCWPGFDQGARRDGIEWGALAPDGTLVFNHHFGAGDKQPSPFAGAFYHAPAGSDPLTASTALLTLLAAPPGGSEPYDYLLAPVFTRPREVTGLAVAVSVAETNCPRCVWDTVYTGLDLVRLSLDAPGTVEVLARVLGARFLAWDGSVDRFFYGRADRIEAVPTDGGPAAIVWQLPRSPDRGIPVLTGVAAGDGRVGVSWHYTDGDTRHSVIGLLRADGGVDEVVHSINGPRWGAISLSPDGNRLVAERTEGGQRDLYLWVFAGGPADGG